VGASPIRIVALVVLAFCVGLAVRGFLTAGSSDEANAIGPAVGADATGSGPRSYVDGIPSGFAHTEDGARAAAIAYVLTGQRLLELVPTKVAAAVRSMAASGSAEAQVTEADEKLRRLRDTLTDGTGPTRYLQAVLASRADAFTPERARVSVWSVGVLSRIGVAQPQAGWSISTFELVWERADWRIWSERITPGPAPDLNASVVPASASQLEQALLGFTPWRSGQ
jgi:hypothetical protein